MFFSYDLFFINIAYMHGIIHPKLPVLFLPYHTSWQITLWVLFFSFYII